MVSEESWVAEEVAGLALGDERLHKRVQRIVADWSAQPGKSIPEFSGDWAATKGAYRLLENESVRAEAVRAAQWAATRQRIAAWQASSGERLTLCIQDTTSIDVTAYTSMAGRGALPRGSGGQRGFLAHTTLAVSSSGVPLGVLQQHTYVREDAADAADAAGEAAERTGKSGRRRKPDKGERATKLVEDKESVRWLLGASQSLPEELPGELLFVSDRESDIADYFAQMRPAHVHLLVRSQHNRKLALSEHKLWQALGVQEVAGTLAVEVSKQKGRSQRVATCEIRYKPVTILPPNKNRHPDAPHLPPLPLYAISVIEIAAGTDGHAEAAGAPVNTPPPPGLPTGALPAGDAAGADIGEDAGQRKRSKRKKQVQPEEAEEAEEAVTPINWRLLTTCPLISFVEACLLVKYYSMRWFIERFHYVLKSGCNIERHRLASVDALQRLLAIANIVAWRLLWLTHLARLQPDLPCTVALSDAEWKALYVATNRTKKLPDQPPTLQHAVRAIAKLGGFLGRRSDGQPGVTVLWRGWQHLADLTQMWLLLQPD